MGRQHLDDSQMLADTFYVSGNPAFFFFQKKISNFHLCSRFVFWATNAPPPYNFRPNPSPPRLLSFTPIITTKEKKRHFSRHYFRSLAPIVLSEIFPLSHTPSPSGKGLWALYFSFRTFSGVVIFSFFFVKISFHRDGDRVLCIPIRTPY